MITKRFLFLSLIVSAFALASCSSDDDSTPPIETETMYTGAIQVTANDTTPPFTLSGVTCEVILDESKETLDLLVNDVKFDEAMPLTIDITLPDIPCSVVGETVSFSFEGNLVPLVGQIESPKHAFSRIDGVISDSRLNFNSTCTMGLIAFDGEQSE